MIKSIGIALFYLFSIGGACQAQVITDQIVVNWRALYTPFNSNLSHVIDFGNQTYSPLFPGPGGADWGNVTSVWHNGLQNQYSVHRVFLSPVPNKNVSWIDVHDVNDVKINTWWYEAPVDPNDPNGLNIQVVFNGKMVNAFFMVWGAIARNFTKNDLNFLFGFNVQDPNNTYKEKIFRPGMRPINVIRHNSVWWIFFNHGQLAYYNNSIGYNTYQLPISGVDPNGINDQSQIRSVDFDGTYFFVGSDVFGPNTDLLVAFEFTGNDPSNWVKHDLSSSMVNYPISLFSKQGETVAVTNSYLRRFNGLTLVDSNYYDPFIYGLPVSTSDETTHRMIYNSNTGHIFHGYFLNPAGGGNIVWDVRCFGWGTLDHIGAFSVSEENGERIGTMSGRW